jgi:glycosyltransferase involved in cell wall biosynthesis
MKLFALKTEKKPMHNNLVTELHNSCLVSIITIVLNGEDHIEQTICSVLEQNYKEIEYIIIDGGSIDSTLSIIDRYKDRISMIISESDNGIYDAINKGILLSTGSLIGILHCGDYYEPGTVTAVVNAFLLTGAGLVYGDLNVIESEWPVKLVRILHANHNNLKRGMSIFHPASFVCRDCYLSFGLFNTEYKSVADYDFILRLFVGGAKFSYAKMIFANFRKGGLSGSNFLLTLREHFKIRLINIGIENSVMYVIRYVPIYVYYYVRKFVIESIIGKNNYIKLKCLYYNK